MNIVLAHGFHGFRSFLGIDYFNGLKKALETMSNGSPNRVLVPPVPPAGTIALRGSRLRDEILQALENNVLDPAEKIHIIAHSMGGLDARYCLSPGNPDHIAAKVRSLTTISTPHHGSPIADLLTGGDLLNSVESGIRAQLRGAFEQLAMTTTGILDLTTKAVEAFNARFSDHPGVSYFSYAGRGREGLRPTCVLLLAAHGFINLKTGQENDGLVTVRSATWGDDLIETWPGDHADEIGHDLDGGPLGMPGSFDHLEKYRSIAKMLSTS